MQENNFQKIISQWRRLSGEQVESAALISMSGDSHHSGTKEEDTEKHLLVPDRLPAAVAGASAAAAVVEPAVSAHPQEEKEEFLNPDKDKEESKEESTGVHRNEKDSSYSERNDSTDKSLDSKCNQDRGDKEDKVDSVYLRPPPPHKARSNTSTPAAEEEDCGIKCLYYTLQCCDCVLM